MPRCVPSQTMSKPRRRSTRAVASAGNTCPPVPPAMMSATRARHARRRSRGTTTRPRHDGLVMDPQQHAEPAERDQHAAAAVAEERQRQALGRQQPHVHADVHERLQAEPDADRRREIRLELEARLRGVARDRERASDQQDEQARSRARRPRARTPPRGRRIRSPCAPRADRRASARSSRARRRTTRHGRSRSAIASAGSRCRTDRPTDPGRRPGGAAGSRGKREQREPCGAPSATGARRWRIRTPPRKSTPRPVTISTVAAPKSGSESSSTVAANRTPTGLMKPLKSLRSSSARRTA